MNTIIDFARLRALVGTVLVGVVVAAGCGGDTYEQAAPARRAADAPRPAPAPAAAAANGDVTIAGVTFTPPARWNDLGADGMRQAQFRLPPVDGDPAAAEVNVFYFGPSSGGGVEANLQRWIGQMVPAEGAEPVRSDFTADGMAGHVVALDGGYRAGGGRPMGGGGETLPGYRLVGVVLEGPQGSVFFKLTGPEATARAMETDLLPMVEGARR
jgi:hypothetical protein